MILATWQAASPWYPMLLGLHAPKSKSKCQPTSIGKMSVHVFGLRNGAARAASQRGRVTPGELGRRISDSHQPSSLISGISVTPVNLKPFITPGVTQLHPRSNLCTTELKLSQAALQGHGFPSGIFVCAILWQEPVGGQK